MSTAECVLMGVILMFAVPFVAILLGCVAYSIYYGIRYDERECRHCGKIVTRAPEMDRQEFLFDDGLSGHKDAPGRPIPYTVKVFRCENCGKVYDESDLQHRGF